MILDLNDPGLSRALILFRTREVDHKLMLERIVRPGMRIFDIGGNIGYYALMELTLLGGSGHLVAVEPVPENMALLKRNLRLNGYRDVPVVKAAVSDISSRKTFHLSRQSNLGTFHPVGSATLTGDTINVETTTIPMLAERFGPPDLLRMDVEGHEVEILEGMLEDIRKGRYAPIVIFETHLHQYGEDHDMAAILKRLFELGYGVPLVSSSDLVAHRLKGGGYIPGERIATDAVYRTLFSSIRPDDAIDLICRSGGLRIVVLARP